MSIYNLPPLDYDPLPEPSGFGEWEPKPDLAAIASALRVNVEQADLKAVKSIPDAWAQARVFGQALLDSSHELHGAVVAHWRGLLATFALQPFFSHEYDLEIVNSNLAEDPKGDRRFRRVLRDLQPTVSLAPGLSWEKVGVVLLRPKAGSGLQRPTPIPIALVSPWVLLSSGKTAASISLPHVPWLRDGLADPVEVGGLSSDHWLVLSEYIRGVATSLDEGRLHNPEAHIDLHNLLDAYYQACRERVREETPLKQTPVRLTWPHPFFAALGSSWTVDEDQIPDGDSRCALALRPEVRGLFRGVILVDQTIAHDTYRVPPEQVRLFERYTLRDAQSADTFAAIKKAAEAKGFLLIRPEDLFVPTLVRLQGSAAIPGHPLPFLHHLLPLSPLALLLLDRDQINANITLEDRGSAHEVRLTLPLAPDAQGVLREPQHTIVRRYEDADIRTEERLVDLSLWPNFQTPDWTWTFLRFQYAPNYELRPRFALSAEFLLADAQARGPSTQDKIRGLMEWASSESMAPDARLSAQPISEVRDAAGKLLLQRLRFAKTNTLVGEVQRLPRGAEAIFFALGEGDGHARPIGCVLVRPKARVAGAAKATIAIDFGTTNTVAYVKRGEQLRTISFSDRLLFPLDRPQGATEEDLVWPYTDFFPLREHEAPFPTVAKRRSFEIDFPPAQSRAISEGHDMHGVSDNVFFVPAFEKIVGGLEGMTQGDLVFNIKWAKDDYTRRLTKRFLRQVMMMASAELVAEGVSPDNISFKFSHPQAFSDREKGYLEDFIRGAWQDLFGDLPNVASLPNPALSIAMETEGAAAARYFTSDPEQAMVGVGNLLLMLDIGGGTTDIALWHREDLRWRGSFKIAGGDFFTRFLTNNIGILSKIDFDEAAAFISNNVTKEGDAAARFVELFVSAPKFSTNFEASYPGFAPEPTGEALRQCASVALGGLLHYMGLVIRDLVEAKHIQEADVGALTIALGGRGSAFFRLLHRGGGPNTDLARICRLLTSAAGYDPSTVQTTISFSKKPKHEVARGLLIEPPNRGREEAPPLWKAAPAGGGVTYEVGGQRMILEPTDDLASLLNADSVDSVDLNELNAFLTGLHRETGVYVDLASRGGAGAKVISQRTATKLREALRETTEEDMRRTETQALEPPFITSLRLLIEILNRSVAERNEMISVSENDK